MHKIKKIIIPGEFPGMNQIIHANRTNRYAANHLKQKTDHHVKMYALKAMREGIVLDKLPVNFTFIWYVKNRRKDKDNISSAVKFIFDGLVKAGLLENDGWEQVGNISHKFDVDKKNPRIEIYMSEQNIERKQKEQEMNKMELAQVYMPTTKKYERYELPDGAAFYSRDMDKVCSCAWCGKKLKFGDTYTSRRIHTEQGFGYGVCEKCYYARDFKPY
ncbi:hypothetical protein [Allofustis seminis]|uniref:hypothetical protein n=1 Tax=Allofustis seminis TaxID=166939 RepID=UPI000382B906|nr:hypothetical protein [Allofustis seminis]